MKKEGMSFFDWQARFDTEDACKDYLYHEKWPNGFQCPQCGHGIEAVDQINHDTVDQFSKRKLLPDQCVYTDAFRGLTALADTQEHLPRVTPAEKADEWLPWVHIVISNLKRFLLGAFHGVHGKYLQEYINEFCYRFNRRRWESEIPARLLAACATHLPVKTC